MRVVQSIDALRTTLSALRLKPHAEAPVVTTGLLAIDLLLPNGGFALGAVHEILSATDLPSAVLPILVSRSAAKVGWIIWCDFESRFYPPGAAALGLPLDRVLLLRAGSEREQLWAATECLRSKGVGACVLTTSRLSFVQARRMQLAAEKGGGLGLLLRSSRDISAPYAAVTRWLVRPASGERTLQRWQVELIHGHGGHVGKSVLLEVCRETNHVRAISAVANRSSETEKTLSSA